MTRVSLSVCSPEQQEQFDLMLGNTNTRQPGTFYVLERAIDYPDWGNRGVQTVTSSYRFTADPPIDNIDTPAFPGKVLINHRHGASVPSTAEGYMLAFYSVSDFRSQQLKAPATVNCGFGVSLRNDEFHRARLVGLYKCDMVPFELLHVFKSYQDYWQILAGAHLGMRVRTAAERVPMTKKETKWVL